jgi:hypothetical protein
LWPSEETKAKQSSTAVSTDVLPAMMEFRAVKAVEPAMPPPLPAVLAPMLAVIVTFRRFTAAPLV